jgi:transposase-like protein
LVLVGVRADGTKELITLADGYRESTESWADLLRDAKLRRMRALVLAVGDGALGFCRALREVLPETREARCWFHKIANVLTVLPRWFQLGRMAIHHHQWCTHRLTFPFSCRVASASKISSTTAGHGDLLLED